MATDFNNRIKKGASNKPPRILMIGVEGVGKSTAGANMPKPIFLCAEDGLVGAQFSDTEHFTPNSWKDGLDWLEWLAKTDTGHESLVIDTVDWLEKTLIEDICKESGVADIEKYEKGFGRGYKKVADEFMKFLSRLNALSNKGMTILFLAHCTVKLHSNPLGDDYDRYIPKLRSKELIGNIKEWADAVLFARFDDFADKEGGKFSKAKGAGGSNRVVQTTNHAAWDAKNRHNLPPAMTLDMPAILQAMGAEQPGPGNIQETIEQIKVLIPNIPPFYQEKVNIWLQRSDITATGAADTLFKCNDLIKKGVS